MFSSSHPGVAYRNNTRVCLCRLVSPLVIPRYNAHSTAMRFHHDDKVEREEQKKMCIQINEVYTEKL